MVHKLHTKFHQTGSVSDTPRLGCPRMAQTEENTHCVIQAFTENPTNSAKRTTYQLDLLWSTVGCILKDLKFKVYQPHLLKSLSENYFDRRVEFCKWYSIHCESEPHFYLRILWSDEAI